MHGTVIAHATVAITGSTEWVETYPIRCSSFPGLNLTALPGEMLTSAPVRGFLPTPVFRGFTVKTPNPRSSMRSECPKSLLHAFENRVHRSLRLGTGQSGAFDDTLNQILLDHRGHLPSVFALGWLSQTTEKPGR